MSALKSKICDISSSLSTDWKPYTLREVDEDSFTLIDDIDKQESVVSKLAVEESGLMYSCLANESGCKVQCGGIQGDGEKDNFDLIAGAKKAVEAYLDYLRETGESIRKGVVG